MSYPSLDLLEVPAEKLKPLLSEIVFVGGCATGLLISDPGAAPVRRSEPGPYRVAVSEARCSRQD